MSSIWHYVLASRRSRALRSIAAMQLLLLTPMLQLVLHLYAKHTGICRLLLINVYSFYFYNTNCNRVNSIYQIVQCNYLVIYRTLHIILFVLFKSVRKSIKDVVLIFILHIMYGMGF